MPSIPLNEIPIVFMGTPAFAVPTLDALVAAGCQIAAVVTTPDKPAGRGLKAQSSAVCHYAKERGLRLLQPEKLKDPDFLSELRMLNAALQVVVAFRMLPEVVWNMPPMGTINLHASLLPDYRGAAPINWAIMNGETESGLTTFKLQHEIDTGNILLQERLPIGENETAGELHDRMMVAGSGLMLRTIEGLAAGTLTEFPQPSVPVDQLKKAPRIFTETCDIRWEAGVGKIHNQVRGLSPFPGAFTTLGGKLFKIFRTKPIWENHQLTPGQHLTDHRSFLRFACPDGYVEILECQPEGKRRMPVTDFLRGYRGD